MSTMKLPPLYKLNTQGKIELWKVYVVDNYIEVVYGENGSAKFQRKVTKITKGKNLGRANATTVREQAEAEAQAKWEKKLKSGYVKNLKDAEAGKVDKIIKGGVVPMSAYVWQKYKDKEEYPKYSQPKLDGERCVAIKHKGEVTLWSRSRKQINSCPHLVEQLTEQLLYQWPNRSDVKLDCEIYVHGVSQKERERLMGLVRKNSATPETKDVGLFIYDVVDDTKTYEERKKYIDNLPDCFHLDSIFFVETRLCKNEKEVDVQHRLYISEGYEGSMLRDPKALYQHKRTKALLKYKNMIDKEFKIIGVKAGKDNTVIFKCIDKKGATFEPTMSGNKKDNQKYLKDESLWKGKKLTVQYQCLTGKNQVPLFPVGLRIRNDI